LKVGFRPFGKWRSIFISILSYGALQIASQSVKRDFNNIKALNVNPVDLEKE
jgi:hypothetical protein